MTACRYEFYLLVVKVTVRQPFASLTRERYLEHSRRWNWYPRETMYVTSSIYLLGLSSRHCRVSFWENSHVAFGWVVQLWKWLPYLFVSSFLTEYCRRTNEKAKESQMRKMCEDSISVSKDLLKSWQMKIMKSVSKISTWNSIYINLKRTSLRFLCILILNFT